MTTVTTEPISVDISVQAGPTRPLSHVRMTIVIVALTQAPTEVELGVTWTVFIGVNSKWVKWSDHGNQTHLAFSFSWPLKAQHKAVMFSYVDLMEVKGHLKVLQIWLKILFYLFIYSAFWFNFILFIYFCVCLHIYLFIFNIFIGV